MEGEKSVISDITFAEAVRLFESRYEVDLN
jgi:hypothetical protein